MLDHASGSFIGYYMALLTIIMLHKIKQQRTHHPPHPRKKTPPTFPTMLLVQVMDWIEIYFWFSIVQPKEAFNFPILNKIKKEDDSDSSHVV
jgi:uncharacterized membrane protein